MLCTAQFLGEFVQYSCLSPEADLRLSGWSHSKSNKRSSSTPRPLPLASMRVRLVYCWQRWLVSVRGVESTERQLQLSNIPPSPDSQAVTSIVSQDGYLASLHSNHNQKANIFKISIARKLHIVVSHLLSKRTTYKYYHDYPNKTTNTKSKHCSHY